MDRTTDDTYCFDLVSADIVGKQQGVWRSGSNTTELKGRYPSDLSRVVILLVDFRVDSHYPMNATSMPLISWSDWFRSEGLQLYGQSLVVTDYNSNAKGLATNQLVVELGLSHSLPFWFL